MAQRVARNSRVKRPEGVEPEDVVQDAVVAILRVQSDWPAAAPHVPFENWLHRRVIGILQDQYGTAHARQAKAAQRTGEEDTFVQQVARVDDQSIENTELRIDLETALNALPDRQRYIISALHIEGLTQEECAARLGVCQSTVSNQYAKALRRLRDLLGEAYDGD